MKRFSPEVGKESGNPEATPIVATGGGAVLTVDGPVIVPDLPGPPVEFPRRSGIEVALVAGVFRWGTVVQSE